MSGAGPYRGYCTRRVRISNTAPRTSLGETAVPVFEPRGSLWSVQRLRPDSVAFVIALTGGRVTAPRTSTVDTAERDAHSLRARNARESLLLLCTDAFFSIFSI